VLNSLLLGSVVDVVVFLARRAARPAPVLVVGHPRLEKALAAAGVTLSPTIDAASVLVLARWTEASDGTELLTAAGDGTEVIFVGDAASEVVAAHALCAGVVGLEQRAVATVVITSGKIRRWI
jgi:hypothetical protein